MTADDATRARMDGRYTPPVVSEPTAVLPIPAWDPPQTPSADGRQG